MECSILMPDISGNSFRYRNIPSISRGLIDIISPFWGLVGGAYIRGELIFGGHFVLVSAYKGIKFHYHINKISLLQAKKDLF